MFDIGFWELLVIIVVGLLVLGPERLPSALRGVQRGMAKVKAFSQNVQNELDHELRVKELHEHLRKFEQEGKDFHELSPELQRSIVELQNAAADVQRPYQAAEESDSEPKKHD